MRFPISIFILFVMSSASARECAKIFPITRDLNSPNLEIEASERSPAIRTILKRLARARASNQIQRSTLPAPVEIERATLASDVQANASSATRANPHLQSFRRLMSLNLFGDPMNNVAHVLKILNVHFSIVSEQAGEKNPKHFYIDRLTGNKIEISHAGLEFLQLFMSEARKEKKADFFPDGKVLDIFQRAVTQDVGHSRLQHVSFKSIESVAFALLPEGPTDYEDAMIQMRYNRDSYEYGQRMRSAHYTAKDQLRHRTSIDFLTIVMGREALFELYFDVLYALRAQKNGESFSTPLIAPMNFTFWKKLKEEDTVIAQVGKLATSELVVPDSMLVQHFGYEYLRMNPTVVTLDSLNLYLLNPDKAKPHIPNFIFDQLHEQGYYAEDIGEIIRRLPYRSLGYI